MLQERLRPGPLLPWRLIVASCLFNRTSGRRQVWPMAGAFFRKFSSPRRLLDRRAELEDALKPLGLHRRRALALVRMSEEYLAGVDPRHCYGVGEYGAAVLDVFLLGKTRSKVRDGVLQQYLKQVRRKKCHSKR